MNNELNFQVNTILADFQKRQEEIRNEIANLNKSTKVIEDNILKEYEIVTKSLAEDLEPLLPVFKSFNKRTSASSEEHMYKFFSVFKSKEEIFYAKFYASTYDNSDVGICIRYDGWDNQCSLKYSDNKVLRFYSSYHSEPTKFEKELFVKYLSSGDFLKQVIDVLRYYIDSMMKEYQTELERQKRILENAEPITKNDSHWSDYILYLLKWSSEHADKEYAGMSPACYDEWLDNEEEE